MDGFDKLGLKKDIIDVLDTLEFSSPTEIQKQVIPLVKKGKNVVFTSKTGSGKTNAYLIGYLGKVNKKLGIQVLVMVPTRELCIQVGKEAKKLCDPLGINVGMLYGGRDIKGDYRTTRKKNHILVGTPGRLIQHINDKVIKVGEVKYLVYDESDQMFDLGFIAQCSYIRDRVSIDSQVVLSSATITDKVRDFIDDIIIDFEFLRIGDQIPKNIIQEKLSCEISDKNNILLNIVRKGQANRVIVFCNTKVRSNEITEFLVDNGFKAGALNGDLTHEERINHLNSFKDGKINILVATDVCSRGIHIENVDMVVNYDIPKKPEFYVHRIGRTGRNDKKGYSVSMVCPEDEDRFYNIEFEYQLDVRDISL